MKIQPFGTLTFSTITCKSVTFLMVHPLLKLPIHDASTYLLTLLSNFTLLSVLTECTCCLH